MATRTEANTVYAAGLVQGIVLVTFPAASTIFTDPAQYDLSSTQYGTMFPPQVITAIIASLLQHQESQGFSTAPMSVFATSGTGAHSNLPQAADPETGPEGVRAVVSMLACDRLWPLSGEWSVQAEWCASRD